MMCVSHWNKGNVEKKRTLLLIDLMKNFLMMEMLDKIYSEIESHRTFIIADLSNRNSNVFYELGYAHAIGKLCILITQYAENIPFDLKHRRHIVYGSKLTYLQEQSGQIYNGPK